MEQEKDRDDTMQTICELEQAIYKGEADSNLASVFRSLVEREVARGSIDAMCVKAYQCYEGTIAYTQDYVTARLLLRKVYAATQDPYIANSLGYIYYYGRGLERPYYDAARRYFEVAAAEGVVEARYKMADLFMQGLGVVRSLDAAENIVTRLYSEELAAFCCGDYQSKFADVALRRAQVIAARALPSKDILLCKEAYRYALQARYALKLRAADGAQFGDAKVATNIDWLIERLNVTKFLWHTGRIDGVAAIETQRVSTLFDAVELVYPFTAKIKPKSAKRYKINITRSNSLGTKTKLLVTVPELDYCALHDKVTITARGVHKAVGKIGKKFLAVGLDVPMHYDIDRTVTDNRGEPCYIAAFGGGGALVAGKNYSLALKKQERGQQIRMASVEFSPGGKLYDYILENDNLVVGDSVRVPAGDGEATVTLKRIFFAAPEELKLPFNVYKTIK